MTSILLYTFFILNELFHHVENTKSGHMVKKNKAGTFYGGWYLLPTVLIRLSLKQLDSPDHRLLYIYSTPIIGY